MPEEVKSEWQRTKEAAVVIVNYVGLEKFEKIAEKIQAGTISPMVKQLLKSL